MKILYLICFYRSSLALKHQLDVGAGVIDRDYRGNVGVVMFNLGQTDYQVCRGDRVAQLVIERICTPELVEVEVGSCNTILIEKYIDATKCWLIL